jgi:hypothetical protein
MSRASVGALALLMGCSALERRDGALLCAQVHVEPDLVVRAVLRADCEVLLARYGDAGCVAGYLPARWMAPATAADLSACLPPDGRTAPPPWSTAVYQIGPFGTTGEEPLGPSALLPEGEVVLEDVPPRSP